MGFTIPRCCAIAPGIEKVGQKSYSWAGGFNSASAQMIGVLMDNLPVMPATSIQEIKNRLRSFVEAGADRLIVPHVPVTEPVIDDAHRFVEAWGKL